ncbi:hypothetical protein [Rhodococcus qingshengii]|uniref:hypothetical protein n=1 Tax=Rhodococcus qingshengii TaxID=334542 RepID=UPI001BE9F943|nr:hypothetical protein [Rhodococcus qingshengii]MBT2272730.1 hypothetical protein [Rhodococcus qingshengii]
MTGVFHGTQVGEVTETWSMSSSVLLQTGSIDIEVFCRSTELRGEVLESRKRLAELHQTFMRAIRREEMERVNHPGLESQEITRLALDYFGGAKQPDLGMEGYELFRRAVAEFAKQTGEHDRELDRSRRQAQIAGTRFLEELERYVETFTPLDGNRQRVTYIALDPGRLQIERGRVGPGLDLAEPDADDTYIFEPAEVISRFVYSAVAAFDLSPEKANTLAGELYSALEKMPVPVYGSVPESIKSFGGSLSATGFVGAIGYSAELQSVTLICLSAGAAFIFWFGRPHMTTIRDTSNEWLKRKMINKLGLADDGDDGR